MNKRIKQDRKKPLKTIVLVLAAAVVVGMLIFVLLLSVRPAGYQPAEPSGSNQVNPYVTHYLAPEVYNNIQLDKPFELVIPQDELNRMLADSATVGFEWPVKLDGLTASAPAVAFAPGMIAVMGTVCIGDIPIVVTIEAEPAFDSEKMLIFNIRSVKAGSVNITPLAAIIASSVFAKNLPDPDPNDPDAVLMRKVADALLNNTPIEPVFPIDQYNVRLTDFTITDRSLALKLTPARQL